MLHIFTYGSLMFDQVWSRLISTEYKKTSARLSGFMRKAVMDETYPVILKGVPSDIVEGILYYDVTTKDTARLDDFEGEYYNRKSLPVQTLDGNQVEAQVYVLNDSFSHIVSPDDWDPDYFWKNTMPGFIKSYMGFSR